MFFLILLDADCSGRTLATLLIAWVTIAMVASILLEWEYMWIVLMVLTLLFLFICGYTAYNVKKTNARMLIEQQRRAAIRTVSSITAANRREMELYRTHLHVDLPPSYTSVVTTQTTTSTSPRVSDEDKYENPPPYSIVIASLNNTQEQNAEISSESDVSSSKFRKSSAADAAAATSASTSLACPQER
ncbi:hypothetical protein ACS0PU_008033 [Formica fusca]|uniref:uncharacterized protein LOC115239014 isoform X2 n=1 Tax=Formica exsecta TaxID=72781 RepID=UPI001142DA69|nr:uncharacterized protein LOC115239014 isoform X2 [Formica exsecta]XP_029669161.1 uncharacterized protein LOC115239014 isoform X2 [Formica exsecta]